MAGSGDTISVLEVEDSGLVSEYDKEINFILGLGAVQTVSSSGMEIPPQDSFTDLISLKVSAAPGTVVCVEGTVFFDESSM